MLKYEIASKAIAKSLNYNDANLKYAKSLS